MIADAFCWCCTDPNADLRHDHPEERLCSLWAWELALFGLLGPGFLGLALGGHRLHGFDDLVGCRLNVGLLLGGQLDVVLGVLVVVEVLEVLLLEVLEVRSGRG